MKSLFRFYFTIFILLFLNIYPFDTYTIAEEFYRYSKQEIWQKREEQRFENQRRDCVAQWLGITSANKINNLSEEVFMNECVSEARTRCHPPGHNPNCVYKSRKEKLKERKQEEALKKQNAVK